VGSHQIAGFWLKPANPANPPAHKASVSGLS
jgi:hypothetical protein